jgi:hypothetical protein
MNEVHNATFSHDVVKELLTNVSHYEEMIKTFRDSYFDPFGDMFIYEEMMRRYSTSYFVPLGLNCSPVVHFSEICSL